jgi:NAD(P)-dependent dehydrogenase (short-subunit alcohol dehydrogenase family)
MRPCALITGASYGVGAATALAFARAGYDLVVTATDIDNLDATVDQIEPTGARVLAMALDLRAQPRIEEVVARGIEDFGRIDVLVNNAAANLRKAAVDVTPDEFNDVMAINVNGTFFLTQEVGRRMIGTGEGGAIVMVSSAHALIGAAERSTYGISKAAVIQMTRMLAAEWASHDIRVNAVAPGRLETESPSRAGTGSNPASMAAMLDRIPLHRFATVDEVASAILYLAGQSAGSITGQVLVLDGGLIVV